MFAVTSRALATTHCNITPRRVSSAGVSCHVTWRSATAGTSRRTSGTSATGGSVNAEQAGADNARSGLPGGGGWIDSVRDPRISDLLGRRPVRTDVAAIAGHFAGRRILVTGAGGSIGSELCRQLHQFAPAELIMLDRDESALHEVQLDAARPRPARLRRDRARGHQGPASRPRGLRTVPAADRLPRRGAQAPAAPRALPGRGGAEQRLRHPDGARGRRRMRRRVVREHLHRQGRRSGQRARLLQEDRGAAHRAHGGPGRRNIPERPVRQRPRQPRFRARRAVRAGAGGRSADGDASRRDAGTS